LATHYQILGVSPRATEQEIKIAFRKLAKQHHPDVNPLGKEAFARALLAYETLTDPQRRRLYDLSIATPNPTTGQGTRNNGGGFDSQKKQKDWSFSEEELKRRQYYQEYYKSRQYTHPEVNTQTKKPYSDYRFMLFAMPLAIALLMFIFFIYEPRERPATTDAPPTSKETAQTTLAEGGLRHGDRPYSNYFGNGHADTTAHNTLSVINTTASEAIVAIFRKSDSAFVQSVYLDDHTGVEISNVPAGDLYVKFILGFHWNPDREVFNRRLLGGFDSIVMYGRYAELPPLPHKGDANGPKVEISANQPSISELEFFQKKK